MRKKNFFLISTIILSLFFFSNANSQSNKYFQGKGNLVLSDSVAKEFAQYVQKKLPGRGGQNPIAFWITQDGSKAYWWTEPGKECLNTWDNEIFIRSKNNVDLYGPEPMCQGRDRLKRMSDECSSFFQLDWDNECKLFARNRTVVWLNDVNKGKGKKSKVNSRWDENRIISKLSELGFSSHSSSSSSSSLKITNKNKKSDSEDSIVYQLKELKSLYDDGVLTQEEYIKAQNNLLN